MRTSSSTTALVLRRPAQVWGPASTRSSVRPRLRPVVRAAAPSRSRSVEATVSLGSLFWTFMVIGASSFGGGVTAHLREHLVKSRGWLNDDEFMGALEIAQALPGLNSTNMSVVVGDRLAGPLGAVVATLALMLPGLAGVLALGMLYATAGARPGALGFMKGAAAAAVGMTLSTTIQLGRRPLARMDGVVLALVTFWLSAVAHWSLPLVLLVLTPLALWQHRPRVESQTSQAPLPSPLRAETRRHHLAPVPTWPRYLECK